MNDKPAWWRRTAALLALLAGAATATAASYYVDDTGGSDANAGTSTGAAWKTLDKVTAKTFAPGDHLYFKAGGVWTGRVQLKGNGSAALPIVVDQYGTGNKPKIDGGGYESAVLLLNTSYWELNNLEIVNDGGPTKGFVAGSIWDNPVWDAASAFKRYGIYVLSNSAGVRSHIYFKNLYIHNIFPETCNAVTVNGVTKTPDSHGISVLSAGTNTDTYYDDVRLEDCYISFLYRFGFVVESQGSRNTDYFYHKNIMVRGNTFYQTGGSGAMTAKCDGVLLENNVMDWSGYQGEPRMWNRGSGYWPYYCRNVTVQNNQFMHSRGIADSCGMHVDLYNDNVLVQYNFSFDNEGGFCEVLDTCNNITYRYNVSVNDGARINAGAPGGKMFFILGGSTNVNVYNNTVYVKSGMTTTLVIQAANPGQSIRNNIFMIEGELINTETAGTNPGNFNGNLWYGNFPGGLPVSATDIFVDPLLVNAGGITAEDYKLTDASPAIGTGVAIADAAVGTLGTANIRDYWGTPLPVTLRTLGAYEINHNLPPVPTPQSVSVFKNTARSITLAAVDVNGDALTYTVATGPVHGSLAGTAPDLTYTPAGDYTGADSFTFQAADNSGAVSASVATVAINVATDNQVPVANAGVDQSVDDSDGGGLQGVTLNGSGSADGDGTLTAYVWTEGATTIATGSTPTVSLAIGVHTLTLTVTDNNGGTATDTVNAAIVALGAPTITVVATDSVATETATNNGVFTLTRTAPTTSALDVLVSIGGTATNGVDYAALSPLVHFNAGSATATLTVVPVNDAEVDPAETVTFTTFAATPSTAKVTITDNDLPTVTLAVNDNSCAEVGSNTGIFMLTRNGSTAAALTVNYTLGGNSINGTDYSTLTGSATFAVGSSTAWTVITPINDTIYEGTEDVILTLSAGSTYLLGGTTSGTITIADNDLPDVSMVASATTLTEGGAAVVLTFTRTGITSLGSCTIPYTVTGTATNGSDCTPWLSGSITIPQGQATATINISALQDNVAETPETLTTSISLNAAVYNRGTSNAATLTLLDGSGPTVVSVAATDNAASEPARSEGAGTFTLTRSGDTSAALTVNLQTTGTATASGDYIALPATVTIPAGQASATVTVTPLDDSEVEADETVILKVLVGSGYSIGVTSSATVNLYDDEATQLVRVEVTDGKCIEQATPDAGVFTLRRLGNRIAALTVNYTISGTATNGVDYTTLSGTATIAANSSSTTVTVTPINDASVEGTETVIFALAAGTGYTADAQNTGTIELRDDEAVDVNITVPDATCIEQPTADIGSFRITRVVTTAMPVTAPLAVSYIVGGSATNGTDYTTLSGTATIPAGSTTVDVIVTPIDDALVEGAESVIMTLIGAGTTYDIGDTRTQTLWVRDNEVPTITVAATDAAAAEADGGTTNPGLYTFTASTAPSSDLTISYTMSSTAINGVDYDYLPGTIVLPAGQTSVTLALTPIDDELGEVAETASLTLLNTDQYNAGNTAVVNVVIAASDTPAATITAADAGATENPVDTGRFVIALSKIVAANTTVNYTIGGTATPTADYTALTGSVTVTVGTNTATLTVTPADDALVEGLETVSATLAANGTLYTIGTPSAATVTIADDEVTTVSFTATDAGAAEPVTGPATDTGTCTLTRDGVGTGTLTVNLAISGTATNGVDYLALPSTVTFAAAETSKILMVSPYSDALVEGNETVNVSVVAGTGYIRAASPNDTATVTIADATPPYDAWLSAFTFAQGADKTTTGDPDGDGLANLVEYALGLNPTVSNANPIQLSPATVNGSTYLQLSVNRNPAVTNVLIEGLSAGTLTDPAAWSTGTTTIEDNTATLFRVRDSLPTETNSKRFLRLRFTLLP